MFDNISNHNNIIDEYINSYNLNRDNIIFIINKLHNEDNVKDFIKNTFSSASKNSIVIIIDAVVYHDDAFTNTIYSFYNSNFKRIYTVNEVISLTSQYADLVYFKKFNERIDIDNIPNNLTDDIPENIRKNMLVFENNLLKAVNQNFGVYIFQVI